MTQTVRSVHVLLRWRLRVVSVAVGFLVAAAGSLLGAPVYDFGCLASDRRDLFDRAQFRALGPLVEWTRDGVPTLTGVRPFFTYEEDGRGRDELDVLWPLASFRQWDRMSDWRILVAFGHDDDQTDPLSRYRAWILPFAFWGRDAKGQRYGALFPLGGSIHEFCGRDVSFVLFPLYSHSTLDDIDTHNFLYPFVSWTTAKDTRKFRIFPFYGHSVKTGVWDKRFILWPFWTSSRFERPGARGGGFVLFPIYGHLKMENQESWMVVPPFIRWSKSAKGREGYYVWPFVQTASGEKDKVQVWPLFGYQRTKEESSRYFLWPIVYSRHDARPAGDANTFRVFPVYYGYKQTVTNAAAGMLPARAACVWPLFDYNREGDHARLRVLGLWPSRNTLPIERNLAPLWTLYRFERTPLGREHELLWGLAHWERSAAGVRSASVFPVVSWAGDGAADTFRKWVFLKGLLGYERTGKGHRYRALYLLSWGDKP